METNKFIYKIQGILKRVLDIAISLSGMILILPFYGLIILAIKIDSQGGAIFRHRRIGRNGKPFDLYKFRSMDIGGDDNEYLDYLRRLIESERNGRSDKLPYRKMDSDCRVTKVGRILRCYYLDELPQLFNVLKGEMSLVGPRPHVQFEVDNYTAEQKRRLSVMPGLTGLWQVAGKADCSFNELIQLDLEYIDNWSLWLDLKILYQTVCLMFQGGEKFWARMTKKIPGKERISAPTVYDKELSETEVNLEQFVEHEEGKHIVLN